MASRRLLSTALAVAAGLSGSLLFGTTSSAADQARTSTTGRASGPVTATAPSLGQAANPGKRTVLRAEPQENANCLGLVPSPYPYAQTPFTCNDWRFGPADLPRTGILGSILAGYNRLGGRTPVEFLNQWWDPTADIGRGNWRRPADDGFAHDTSGAAIAAPVTLHAGELLDRFGNEFGSFLSPAGAKYSERSIPPSNLNTEDPRYPYNYHLFRVTRDTVVCAGPIAPFYNQPGQGVQYATSVTSGAPYCTNLQNNASVSTLVQNGSLQRAN